MKSCYLRVLSVFQDSKPTTLSHGHWSNKEANSYPLNTTHPWICSCCSPWLKCSFLTPKPPTVVKKSQDYNLLLLFNHPAVSNSVTPWTAAHQASLSLTSSQCLPKFMSIASVMPSSHLILCHLLLLLPPIPPSIRVFSNESAICIIWPKYWSFNFSINPPNEYSELISLVGSPCSPSDSQESSPAPQFKGINSLAFCLLYSPRLYVTTGKTTALTIRTFVSRVMFLLFRILSRLVVAFLSRSKHLLISWLQSPSAVVLKPIKSKSVTTSTFSLFAMKSGPRCHDLGFFNI